MSLLEDLFEEYDSPSFSDMIEVLGAFSHDESMDILMNKISYRKFQLRNFLLHPKTVWDEDIVLIYTQDSTARDFAFGGLILFNYENNKHSAESFDLIQFSSEGLVSYGERIWSPNSLNEVVEEITYNIPKSLRTNVGAELYRVSLRLIVP